MEALHYPIPYIQSQKYKIIKLSNTISYVYLKIIFNSKNKKLSLIPNKKTYKAYIPVGWREWRIFS